MKQADEAFNVKKAEESPGFLLWQVTTLWHRAIKKALDEIDLTHPQFVLLASLLWLSKTKESITQIDLSHHSKIDPMTTSTIIKTLLRKGLVERREHHTDTRAKSVTLTESGVAISRQAVEIINKVDEDFFTGLGAGVKDFNGKLVKLMDTNK
ncbi:MarR family winged helix-turn-helix transcriptional regulator [Mucilaginibacter sp. OK098]|uniref:MarR family winged helix-turn-helix transcriptional regulator n=1 Tax=Mucilaginibacter sp. OK098 TaxID=1855297 RepID=UPI0009183DE8|nr:MarR family transcriptional regulator [Mucilaginibacter sp. OK098]SHN01038.1 DNA-binding transcriptional regulator, MarR family [Mucilaginibacter sp. OK098]